jgi:phytoene dehydrogenase-like protein
MNNKENLPQMDFVIVGAGAAGSAAAKCFAAAGLAGRTALFEQHSEPGGSAGYFSRGLPLRTFDAGATQLIECDKGQLQRTVFELAPTDAQPSADAIFEKIPAITQHWHNSDRKIALHDNGRVEWKSQREPTPIEVEELAKLERFIALCAQEAEWMWKVLARIPRFPLQSWSDVSRAFYVFLGVPWKKKLQFPVLFLLNCEQMMRIHGIRRGGIAWDVLSGLLIDTTQNSPAKSPWLAAAMGISILQRGIWRCRSGMRSYFRPLMSSFTQRGGQYVPNERLTRLESTPEGFRLTLINQRHNSERTIETQGQVLLNTTLWDVVDGLIPDSDHLRQTAVFRKWEKTANTEAGWGAFALYATVEDKPEWPDSPWFHQIFASANDLPELQSSLYVSIPSRNDPANPTGYRILTATIHVKAAALSDSIREQWTLSLQQRIEKNLDCSLSHIETATPKTFERYICRKQGQVGGFPLRFGNFMFLANPSQLVHPHNKNCKLLLMGDTVFPGQGVVACTVSGVVAFERATGLRFTDIVEKSRL